MEVLVNNTTFLGSEKVCKLTGKIFAAYLGIPYAKPPTGDLRFQPPQELDPSQDDEFDATVEGDDCLQTVPGKTGSVGGEDCLFLNVYVPKCEKNADEFKIQEKPVVVFVHGGIFTYMSGSPNNFSPDYVVSQNVIVVTFNYRLHLFGFLDLAVPECPGNVGLLDIVMAFKWVKNNITYFGGDSNNITAFGDSSGAFAVHLLTMSPLTKDLDLFNKMILMSSNAVSPLLSKVNPMDAAFEIGYRLGYRGRNREGLLKFLKNSSADELTETMNAYCNQLKLSNKGDILFLPFLPTIQKLKQDAIIPYHPKNMIKNAKKYPVLTGLMNKEGLLAYFLDPYMMKNLVDDFEGMVKRITKTEGEAAEKIKDMMKSLYFNGNEIKYDEFPNSVDFFTDLYWTYYFNKNLSIFNSPSSGDNPPIYVFEFKYDGALNGYKKYYPVMTRWIEGATHDDILGYCLPLKVDLASKFSNKKDIRMVNNVCSILFNFINTGNPNGELIRVDWKASTKDEPCYLQIADTLKLISGKINSSRLEVWKRIHKIIKLSKLGKKLDIDRKIDEHADLPTDSDSEDEDETAT